MAKVQKGAGDAAAKLIAKYGKAAVTRALKAANTPAKGKVAEAARVRGQGYQNTVDAKLNFKDKGLRQRTKRDIVRKGPGWIGGNSYVKPPKKK